MSSAWFLNVAERGNPLVRLVCLPYAGASAALYRPWSPELPEWLELRSVQLPGRGWRLREAPVRDLGVLADGIAGAMLALPELPTAVFGHSMGAWLGYEVVRRLERAGRRPLCLFASGRWAPSAEYWLPPMSGLADAELIAAVQLRYGGIPAELLQEPEVLQLLLPALRADMAALEEYRAPTSPVETPIIGLIGEADGLIPVERMAGWAAETNGSYQLHSFPGDHFYFQQDPRELLALVRRTLAALLATTRAGAEA